MQQLRERVAAAAAAAAEARLALQRTADVRRGELLSQAAGLTCTQGDLLFMCWWHAFLLALDQVRGCCCRRRAVMRQVPFG